VNVFGAVSVAANPTATTLEDCFRPAGIDWGFPR